MSKRNSQANKAAARERLRAERERQAKRDKIRRQLLVGGSIVAVLAIAGGIGVAIANMGGNASDDWKEAAKEKKYAAPANTTGPKGTTVVIGDQKSKNTLEIFEDMRCPVCAMFEQATGEIVLKDMRDAKYKLKFTMGAFLDDSLQEKGAGSKNALSALGAALNVSPEAFLEYKKTLYSKKNHPEETTDGFADDAKLIEIAQQVKDLKGNKSFEEAVKSGTYDRWALQMAAAFQKVKDVSGTPTLKLNGVKLEVDSPQGGKVAAMLPDQFQPAVEQVLSQQKQ
ncbi:thioredoxin domain-containing protein [Streptomyces sp. KR80]|uniref:thioredoxin domain-containing protein n=1 Tax=Streptomyces sp. KR80 TaxID=3457426 RepID=UPI003FCF570A